MRKAVWSMMLAGLLLASPALAQSSNQAQDRGVHQNDQRKPEASEQDLLNVLRQSALPPGRIDGNVYLPDTKAAVLVQPEGRTWRDFRVGTARYLHAGMIGLALLAIILLAVIRGSQEYRADPQGRRVRRYKPIDRFIHWLTATSFVILALSGLNVVFGRIIIQPWLGDSAFSGFSQWALVAHNFVGYAFILGVLGMLVMWMQDNFFHRVDWNWVKRGAGITSHHEPPAEKFNAGQKLIYWVAVLGGLAMGATGVMMMVPIATVGVNTMQVLQGLHSSIAALMIAVIIGHIYLGVWFVKGSFDAMSRGDVDLNWARQHHSLWLDQERERMASPQTRSSAPPPPHPAE